MDSEYVLNHVDMLATRKPGVLRMHDDGIDEAYEDVIASLHVLRHVQRDRLGKMPAMHGPGDGQR